VSDTRLVWAIIAILTALRIVAAAFLPLSSDETYYWLWSKHLAAGYFDDPPMIAWAIRIGTAIFGDTAFGLRLVPLLAGLIASWSVWRAGVIVLRDEAGGLRACLLFNATVMIAVESFAATPDAPMLAFSGLFLLAVAKVAQTEDGRWWLLAGSAGGLGLMTKNTMFFVGFGGLVWLLAAPGARHWFRSPWPYLGAVVAMLIFLPNILWNAHHHWAMYGLQISRMTADRWGVRYLGEFIGSLLVMATPFTLILGGMGLGVVTRNYKDARLFLPAAILWPSVLYFVWHSLQDRVQGNWPSYLFPALAIVASLAWGKIDWRGWRGTLARTSRAAALPVALAMLGFVYLQAFFNIVPIGRSDPMTRLLGVGIAELGADVEKTRVANGADAILTTDYPTSGWMAFYTPGRPPIIQVGDDDRWLAAPAPSRALESRPMIYVAETRFDLSQMLMQHFNQVMLLRHIDRKRDGKAIAHYVLYRVQDLKAGVAGRQPQG
jgi:4-amino-4-deoxy-L-arabinose transferase-like glycosyltransferase